MLLLKGVLLGYLWELTYAFVEESVVGLSLGVNICFC